MTAAQRWAGVIVGALLLAAAPAIGRALPVSEPGLTPPELLERVVTDGQRSYTGLARTAGHVPFPDTDQLTGLGGLLGETHRVRVWWQDQSRWRVATMRTTGETDLVHSGDRTVRWVYESKNATLIPDSPVRLPDTRDLLPPQVAGWALSGATDDELSVLPGRRVAGREAWGLRLTPSDPQAAIGHVDVFVDSESFVALEVEVVARGTTVPSLTTTFEDFSPLAPEAADLGFTPPGDANLRFDPDVDLAAAAARAAVVTPPPTLAGLPTRSDRGLAVGVYGRGPTALLAIPLDERTAEAVCEELEGRPGARSVDEGQLVVSPPVGLLLTRDPDTGAAWLLAGTVTQAALLDAARELSPSARGGSGPA